MHTHTLICQLCHQRIGKVDISKLSLPLMGSMFESVDPDHGYPPPFQPEQDWQFMMCPYGPHRPFTNPNQILTTEGGLITVEGKPDVLSCPRCKMDDIGMILEREEDTEKNEIIFRCPIHGIIESQKRLIIPLNYAKTEQEEPNATIIEREREPEDREQSAEEGEGGSVERPRGSEGGTENPSGQHAGRARSPKRRLGRPKGSKTKRVKKEGVIL